VPHGAELRAPGNQRRCRGSRRDSAQAGHDSSFANVPWWSVFNDDTLQTLIRRALKENRDVHIALARVNEARALLGIQRLEYYPQINLQAGFRKSDGADSLLTGVTNSEMAWLGGGLSWSSICGDGCDALNMGGRRAAGDGGRTPQHDPHRGGRRRAPTWS
jgi:outer membrane protein TolC